MMAMLKSVSLRCAALLLSGCALMGLACQAQAARLGDIATFEGVRSNPLVGYGLVVGLDNTGDQTMQAPFTGQSVTNMLSELGVTIPAGTNMQLKNVAAVMVTAELPPFSSPGQKLDITVSSVGNARSLRGGTLLMTPLKGADGQIYALAQGNMVIPGISAQAAGSSVQVNQTSSGRIPAGAIIERTVPAQLAEQGRINLELKDADFNTALRTMNAINNAMGQGVAVAQNSRVISLAAPLDSASKVSFLARVQNIDVDPGVVTPKVIMNARTGSVAMNTRVTLSRAAIAHGNLSITIDSNPIISQPNALSGGQTAVVPNADINVQEESGALNMVSGEADLSQVVDALNRLGATPNDLMAILQALKSAGALNADLEII
ncbi:flagellar basal body P-ring protein FlgI [Kushneria marisflavi]|uniref:Flagellar P-ring protein n=1 Tax=Kushneria marisflavi TaxID=157779 RepID=A0A240USG2_9GAMM|nr:flagellar biosynthesis protein FlgI [Kushneria marisflavi]RKD86585.1 flagellar P-ring protein precursor FlgI [Kushneria marisflavi]